jgi:division/cell wall cluster transcriptional repressor MraZ
MIPAKWRPKDSSVVFTAILWPIQVEDFLLVLPPARWQLMLDRLRNNSLRDQRAATLERVIGETSVPLELDKVGRFCLPDLLARAIGLEKEAVFVGRLDKFEIWSPKRYDAEASVNKTLAAAYAEEINL